jgi:hypothetical protein
MSRTLVRRMESEVKNSGKGEDRKQKARIFLFDLCGEWSQRRKIRAEVKPEG